MEDIYVSSTKKIICLPFYIETVFQPQTINQHDFIFVFFSSHSSIIIHQPNVIPKVSRVHCWLFARIYIWKSYRTSP